MSLITNKKMRDDIEALRNRRPEPPRAVEPVPAPTPRRDLIEEQARLAADSLDHLDEFAAMDIASTPAERRAVAIEHALRTLLVQNPRLTLTELAALRAKLLEEGR
jgi:hypothetical protein